MEIDLKHDLSTPDFIFTVLYSSVTVTFSIAVLFRILRNEMRFDIRFIISIVAPFFAASLCQLLVTDSTGFILFSCFCLLIFSVLPGSYLPAEQKWVLITGCDSGFGHALSLELDSLGMQVIATCLNVSGSGALSLGNKGSHRLRTVQLDVTNSKEMQEVVEYIKPLVKDGGLWGLVNNAGVWCFADLEMTSETVFRNVMEVNLFGTIRVTQAVLPLIKKSRGRVVNVSSPLGHMSMEGCGAYSVSKHGLVAYNNTLRMEMKKWGVHVSLVEPTGFLTVLSICRAINNKTTYVYQARFLYETLETDSDNDGNSSGDEETA